MCRKTEIRLYSHFGFTSGTLVIFLAGQLWRGQWFPNSDTGSSIGWLMTGPAEWRDGNGCDASGGLPLYNSLTSLATCHANDPHISIMLPTYIYFAGYISPFLSLLCQTAAGQCKSTVHEIDVPVTSACRGCCHLISTRKTGCGHPKTRASPFPPAKIDACVHAKSLWVQASGEHSREAQVCCDRAGCVYTLPLYLFWEIYYQRHLWAANSPSSGPSIGAAAVQSRNLMGRAGRQSLPWQERIPPVSVTLPPFSREHQLCWSSQSSVSSVWAPVRLQSPFTLSVFVCAVAAYLPLGPTLTAELPWLVSFSRGERQEGTSPKFLSFRSDLGETKWGQSLICQKISEMVHIIVLL